MHREHAGGAYLKVVSAWVLCAAVAVTSSQAAGPEQATPMAEDPVLEAQVLAVAKELRCLVCQNETLAASHAELAVDLRQQIREKLRAGQSPQQINAFMVARYGEFVLYRPSLSWSTVLLWLGPFALMVLAAVSLIRTLRRRRQHTEPPLSHADRARAQALLSLPADASSPVHRHSP